MKISSKHSLSQTVRARKLTILDNVHHMSHVTGPGSHVTGHVLCVTCHGSCVMCHVSHDTKKYYGQRSGAIWWRVLYRRGLPLLISKHHKYNNKKYIKLKILCHCCLNYNHYIFFTKKNNYIRYLQEGENTYSAIFTPRTNT